MNIYKFITAFVVLVLVVFSYQNCGRSYSALNADGSVKAESLDQIANKMKSISESDQTCMQDSDCVLVPVGSRHCGLPTFYLLSSAMNPQHSEVLSLANEYLAQEREIDSSSNEIHTCGVQVPEPPKCVQNICQ